MSVDTTILILVTKKADGPGVEYRVACVQAVENITEYADAAMIKAYFEKVEVLDTLEKAYIQADKEEHLHEASMGFGSEYGTELHEFDNTFKELIEDAEKDEGELQTEQCKQA